MDLQGDLARLIDVARWAEAFQGGEPPVHPCPRVYRDHAKATRSGGHVCLVLNAAQEIKVFAGGSMMFSFSDARWRLLDIPSKFAVWCEAIGRADGPAWPRRCSRPRSTSARRGSATCSSCCGTPSNRCPNSCPPPDQIQREISRPTRGPGQPLAQARQAIAHHVVRGLTLADLEPSILEAMASLDGAASPIWTGDCWLRRDPPHRAGDPDGPRRPGRRTLAALAAWLGGSSRSARTAISPCSSRDGGSGICRKGFSGCKRWRTPEARRRRVIMGTDARIRSLLGLSMVLAASGPLRAQEPKTAQAPERQTATSQGWRANAREGCQPSGRAAPATPREADDRGRPARTVRD